MVLTQLVLGVKCGGSPNGNGHDCNAAIKGQNQICAIQAERIDRIKKSSGWLKGTERWWTKDRTSEEYVGSKSCIKYCLDYLGIGSDQIKLVVVDDLGDEEEQKLEISEVVGFKVKVLRISHHLAHAASAFFCSPFEEAAILIVDGGGGKNKNNHYERQSFYFGKGNKIEHLHTTWSDPNVWGLGGAYAIHQQILGLEAGKVMGLAPYGRGELYNEFTLFERISNLDVFLKKEVLDDDNFEQPKVVAENNIYKTMRQWDDDPVDLVWADIAYKVQTELEEQLIFLCNELYKLTGMKKLCIAGGVGLNSVSNQKILDNTPFEKIFVQPAADDGGIGLGCALYGYHSVLNNPRDYVMENVYLGKDYSDEYIEEVLTNNAQQLDYCFVTDIAKETAAKLADGKIVAWFQGRSEYGPRALGNRSLLCDPRSTVLKDKMNLEVKGREWWRPFAPSVLNEFAYDYFELTQESPFMLLVARVKKEVQSKVLGITHVDGTSRVQTVSKEQNPLYWNLIHKFYQITEVPLLLNTSFNLNRQPIVDSPEDAIDTFLKAQKIDFLVLSNFLVIRKK